MIKENPYLDNLGKFTLLPSYCIFIDILGFSVEIENAFRENREAEYFENFYCFFSRTLEELEEERCKYKYFWMKKVFSDNILIGTPVLTPDGTGEFFQSIWLISNIQLRFYLEGYFVRGGWAIGNLVVDDNIVWGLPLIEAHNLESKIAKYPRIVFSETMKQVITDHLDRYKNDSEFLKMSPQYNQLLYSCGEIFVNYLNEITNDGSGEKTYICWDLLKRHKLLIERRITENKHCIRVLRKYIWLAAYHDAFCDGIEDHLGYLEEYKIRIRHSLRITALDGEPWRRRIYYQPQI